MVEGWPRVNKSKARTESISSSADAGCDSKLAQLLHHSAIPTPLFEHEHERRTPNAKREAPFNSLAKGINNWHYRCCQRARLQQIDLTWNHEAHGSFIRAECADVSLLFDSGSRRWTLRIYKRQTSFGHPVTYEIAFKERYGPTVEQAIALANNILLVELENSSVTS